MVTYALLLVIIDNINRLCRCVALCTAQRAGVNVLMGMARTSSSPFIQVVQSGVVMLVDRRFRACAWRTAQLFKSRSWYVAALLHIRDCMSSNATGLSVQL